MEYRTLDKRIEYYNALDTWEKERLQQAILLQNQFSPEGRRIYQKAKKKGIVL